MIKRIHDLQIGERVFDYGVQCWGHIVAIRKEDCNPEEYGVDHFTVYDLEMDDWEERENRLMFDCEIPDSELKWDTACPEDLYQIADGLVARDGNLVCYEHNETQDDYPYFSPYLDENLFGIEVDKPEEWAR